MIVSKICTGTSFIEVVDSGHSPGIPSIFESFCILGTQLSWWFPGFLPNQLSASCRTIWAPKPHWLRWSRPYVISAWHVYFTSCMSLLHAHMFGHIYIYIHVYVCIYVFIDGFIYLKTSIIILTYLFIYNIKKLHVHVLISWYMAHHTSQYA